MTDIRSRLADALAEHINCDDCLVDHESLGTLHLADVLLALPGIAIVDTRATESVAKAIFANRRHHEPVHAWGDLYSDEMDSYRAMAREALAAAVQAQEEQ